MKNEDRLAFSVSLILFAGFALLRLTAPLLDWASLHDGVRGGLVLGAYFASAACVVAAVAPVLWRLLDGPLDENRYASVPAQLGVAMLYLVATLGLVIAGLAALIWSIFFSPPVLLGLMAALAAWGAAAMLRARRRSLRDPFDDDR